MLDKCEDHIDESRTIFLLRAQSELLEAALTDQAREQRQAIGRRLKKTFVDLVNRLNVPLVLEIGARAGSSKTIKQRQAVGRRLKKTFVDLVNRLNVPLVLEIGAHAGSFSKTIKKSRPETRVVAFEAHPHVYARHAAAMERAGVEYLNLCIAEREGDTMLKVPKKDGAEALNMGSLLRHKRLTEWSEYPVRAVALDGFLGDAAQLSNVLWIDVEGALAQVFAGAERTLRNCQAIYVEMEAVARWEGQWIDTDVVSHLANYGLKPVLRDIQKRRFYNAIFTR